MSGDAVAACASVATETVVAFALGDGRVRLLPADLDAGLPEAPTPVRHGGVVLSLVADPAGDGFVSGATMAVCSAMARTDRRARSRSYKGKWIEHLAAHRSGPSPPPSGAPPFSPKAARSGNLGLTRARSPVSIAPTRTAAVSSCAHYGGVTVWSLARDQRAAAPVRFGAAAMWR